MNHWQNTRIVPSDPWIVKDVVSGGLGSAEARSVRLVKSSEYIPRKMETKIIRMNNEKVPVAEILTVLRNRSKRKK